MVASFRNRTRATRPHSSVPVWNHQKLQRLLMNGDHRAKQRLSDVHSISKQEEWAGKPLAARPLLARETQRVGHPVNLQLTSRTSLRESWRAAASSASGLQCGAKCLSGVHPAVLRGAQHDAMAG